MQCSELPPVLQLALIMDLYDNVVDSADCSEKSMLKPIILGIAP